MLQMSVESLGGSAATVDYPRLSSPEYGVTLDQSRRDLYFQDPWPLL